MFRAKIFLLLLFMAGQLTAQESSENRLIIFDADMGPDYDDAGALAVLHALADSLDVNILATLASNRQPEKAKIFDVINTYYGHPDIPIGMPKGIAVERSDRRGWGQFIVGKYEHDVGLANQVTDAIEIYRKILSQQPDNSVTIISVGFFTNLAKLLLTKSDKFSSLTGMELVSKKVKNLVSMAGKFPSGIEHNVKMDIPSANFVFKNWPSEIIFCGFEIGSKVKTGIPLINDETIVNNPVKDAYQMCIPQAEIDQKGRSSWDQIAVLVGVLGIEPYYKKVGGRISVNSDGLNNWDYSDKGHFYLVDNKGGEYMTSFINRLMKQQPKK